LKRFVIGLKEISLGRHITKISGVFVTKKILC